jgi:mono/diheme cytochrome c family protein
MLRHNKALYEERSRFSPFARSKKDGSDLPADTSKYNVEAIMKLPIPLLAFLIPLQSFTADSGAPAKHTAIFEQGKQIFVARCAKCHNNDANKKLPDGTTLLGRLAKAQDPEARLGTRLKDLQERHAVMIYVDSLLKNLQSPSR